MQSLFGLISLVTQHLKRLMEFMQISHHLSLVYPQKGSDGTKKNNFTASMKERCRHQATDMAAVMSSQMASAAASQPPHHEDTGESLSLASAKNSECIAEGLREGMHCQCSY